MTIMRVERIGGRLMEIEMGRAEGLAESLGIRSRRADPPSARSCHTG
jgi:hypothetical protein